MGFWETLSYIFVLIAIIAAAYWVTKYISQKGINMQSRQMRILDRMTLGKDKHIVLIQIGDKNLLIGVTSQTINTLGDIDINTLHTQACENTTPAAKSFTQQLRDFFIRIKNAPADLNHARAQSKGAKWSEPSGSDYLGMMDDAMQKRKKHADDFDKEGQ
jgi:flagellar biosynthetic protein FliO